MRLYAMFTAGTAAFALALSGCATTTLIQIKRAPELSLPGVKTVKVKPFDLSGDLDLELASGGGGLLGDVVSAGLDAGTNALASKKDTVFQKQNLEDIKRAIVQNGYYKVTEGDDYDVLITGTSFYEVKDDGKDGQDKDSNNKTTYWYEIQRKANTRFSFSVVDKAGKIVAASEAKGLQTASARANDKAAALGRIDAWQGVVRKSFSSASESLVRKIAPYFVTERRVFATGDDKAIKEANKYAGDGNWDAALPPWKAALNGTPKDKAAALHNLAIYDEYQGNADDALAKYEELQKLDPSTTNASDVTRTKTRVEEVKKLKDADKTR